MRHSTEDEERLRAPRKTYRNTELVSKSVAKPPRAKDGPELHNELIEVILNPS